MYGEKRSHDWNIAASLMANVANCHRDPKRQRPLTHRDFLPADLRRASRPGGALTPAALRAMKPLFEQT